MTRILFGLLTILFFPIFINAQVSSPCGISEMDAEYIKNNPDILEIKRELEEFTQEFIKSNKNDKNEYVIPVVFHIIHNGGVENIPKLKMENAIVQMNDDFAATNNDIKDVIPEFENIIGAANIVMRLAQIDPDGNCTEGITRTQSEATYFAGDNVKYIARAWPRDKYLNIWVVHSIGSGAAAYSNYPSSVANNPAVDGVVSKYNYVGNISSGRHTLSHEVGHYLNLIHPWGSTNSPTISTNCQTDDSVEDTPNTLGAAVGSCNLSQSTCGSLDNVQNIMDYSGCDRMLTQGQVDRMHAALNSTISDRNNLWTEQNLIETGTNADYVSSPCSPIAGFMYNKSYGCEGLEITFADYSYNALVNSRSWSFPGGIPAESTDSVVTVLYENAGQNDVSLEVVNNLGSDQAVQVGLIKLTDTVSGYESSVIEDFENASFPVNNEDDTKSWSVINNGSGNWSYTTEAAFTGESSLRIKNYLNGEGVKNILNTPNIDISDLNEATLSFRMAYARKTETTNDELRVYFSRDCGVSWALKYAKSGSSLSSIIQTDLFIPVQEDWRLELVNMSSIAAWNHLKIKIEVESFRGNALYIDDFRITEVTSSQLLNNIDFDGLRVYPNPVDENTVVAYKLNKASEVEIKTTNLLGKELFKNMYSQEMGYHEISIYKQFALLIPGTYIITISNNRQSKNIKFIKL